MGKLPTSLLSIVFQLYLISSVFADDQVRKIQEELRKRHLFYGDITGRTHSSVLKTKPHKETNPNILAFHSVDHTLKILLGSNDATKKGKVAAKSSRSSRRSKLASALWSEARCPFIGLAPVFPLLSSS